MKLTILLASIMATTITIGQNVGIGTNAPTAKLHVVRSGGITFYAFNDGASGYGIVGESNGASAYGVRGLSDNGIGVYGESITGTGVKGYGNNTGSVAVFGSALAGTGVKAFSFTGMALEVLGNLSISGGSTNPIPGALLTSVDANGNAVWKPKKIAFSVYGHHASYTTIPYNTTRKMHFSTVTYDYGGNYNLYTGGTPTTNSSTFQVPVNGLYHFNLKIGLQLIDFGPTDDFTEIIGTLRRTRAGNTIDVAVLDAGCCIEKDWRFFLNGGYDIPLQAGDLIHMEVTQRNDGDLSASILIPTTLSGHLVFAD